MKLQVTPQAHEGHHRLLVAGAINLATVPALSSELTQRIQAAGKTKVVIDLDAVTSIDDIGLGVLLGAAATGRARGVEVALHTEDDALRERLSITGVDRAIHVEPRIDSGYVAVIFTSRLATDDTAAYDAESAWVLSLVRTQPGFRGLETARGRGGIGITVSYWDTVADAQAWKSHTDHLLSEDGHDTPWYDRYEIRVANVEHEFSWGASPDTASLDANDFGMIYHLALTSDWKNAQASGSYTMSTRDVTLEQEGFIHCSLPHQLARIANTYYKDLDALTMLHIDTKRLTAEVKFERSGLTTTDKYPHVYGAIPVSAVTATTVWWRGEDGRWSRPHPD